MTRANEAWNYKSLLMLSFAIVVAVAVAIGGLLFAAQWVFSNYASLEPTESVSEYPSYRSGFFGSRFQFLPVTIPTNASDTAVRLRPGFGQGSTSIQLRVVWPDQSAFTSEVQRLEALDQTQAIRTADAPNEYMLLMDYPSNNTSTSRLQWITDLPVWLTQDPDRRVMLMHFDWPAEEMGAVAVCPTTLTIYYAASSR